MPPAPDPMARQLEYLEAFALPIIEEMARWPAWATWGEWLDRADLAPRALKSPAHVLRVLADLRPMGEVGPVDLDEATCAGRAVVDDGVRAALIDTGVCSWGHRHRHEGAHFASCSFRVWLNACSRRSRARIRSCSMACGRS